MESEVNRDEVRKALENPHTLYILDNDGEPSEEYARFFFLANYDGRKVIADAALYTLRMHHESELYELAEEKFADQVQPGKSTNKTADELEEEAGMLMAEIIVGLEEEQAVKVQEHVELEVIDESFIAIDAGLNITSVTEKEITDFIKAFNEDRIELDPTLYSFQSDDYGESDD